MKWIMRASKLILTAAVIGSIGVPVAVAMELASSHKHAQTTWASPHAKPLSDEAAAAQVTHHPETRPKNVPYNDYVPSNAQLRVFYTTRGGRFHLTSVQENPLNAYVTGRDHLRHPSTDDLVQWAAHKWGIPEDWMRAQTTFESLWFMYWPGDLTKVSHAQYWRYPASLRESGWRVWLSVGISQIKWTPDGSTNVGTDPLRRLSTAFNLDYLGAQIRYYYDGRCRWCKPGYHPAQKWLSIGGWNRPQPWNNSRQWWYIGQVKHNLAAQVWKTYRMNDTFQRLMGSWNNDRWMVQP